MLAVLVILWSIGFLADIDGPQNALIGLYNTFGLTDQAEALPRTGSIRSCPRRSSGSSALPSASVASGSSTSVCTRSWRCWAAVARPPRAVAVRGPALLIVSVFLVFPAVTTIVTSLTEGEGFIENYGFVFTDPDMLIALRNNALWLVLVTGGSVIIGLVIATLVDRVKAESLVKTFIFLPLAISMAGAAVIWRFVYAWQPPRAADRAAQRGLDRARQRPDAVAPDAGDQHLPDDPDHGLAPDRVRDGCPVRRDQGHPERDHRGRPLRRRWRVPIFFRIIVPSIWGSIIVVATTIAVAAEGVRHRLRDDRRAIRDGGRRQPDVQRDVPLPDLGHASALAVILFIAVIPIMVINIRNMRQQGIGA